MRTKIESIILENKEGQRLRIYQVEGSNTFCIGLESDSDHFSFAIEDAAIITDAINKVVDSF
jgi:hypothetical protein